MSFGSTILLRHDEMLVCLFKSAEVFLLFDRFRSGAGVLVDGGELSGSEGKAPGCALSRL